MLVSLLFISQKNDNYEFVDDDKLINENDGQNVDENSSRQDEVFACLKTYKEDIC